jgi:hypothetical protein
MATYIEYTLEDGSILLVEADEDYDGVVKASDSSGNRFVEASKTLNEALASVKQSVATFRHELSALETDEVEVSFGIKVVTEGGLFAIAKAGAEVNYHVTLKWKQPA